MRSRPLAALAALLLGLGAASAPAAPPTDAQVEAAVKAYAAKEDAAVAKLSEAAQRAKAAADSGKVTDESERLAVEAAEGIRPSERMRWADESLAGLDVRALTLAQVLALIKGRVVPVASKSGLISDHLGDLARAQTPEGAEAAALRLSFLEVEPDVSAQQSMLRRALTHPSLQAALKAGRGYTLFLHVQRGARPDLLPEILAMEKVLTPDMPPVVASRAPLLMDSVIGLTGDDDVAAREPLRIKLLELVRAAQAGEVKDDIDRRLLAAAQVKLDGAFLKGALLDNPAPPLEFTWTSLDPAIKSLADLKGKVVVMDFWATWCGPCIAAFPDMKKLQARYEGYPVVILGVTSLQGYHVLDARRIDCTGDPQKETALMEQYIKAKDITWKVAFSKQPLFNWEFGVLTLPHMIIVDPQGVVRHRKLHPNAKETPLSDKAAKIDALLRDAHLAVPPPLPPEDPKKPAGKG